MTTLSARMEQLFATEVTGDVSDLVVLVSELDQSAFAHISGLLTAVSLHRHVDIDILVELPSALARYLENYQK